MKRHSGRELLDDIFFRGARYRAAGNPTLMEIYAAGVHGFTLFRRGMAGPSRASQMAFVGECAGTGAGAGE